MPFVLEDGRSGVCDRERGACTVLAPTRGDILQLPPNARPGPAAALGGLLATSHKEQKLFLVRAGEPSEAIDVPEELAGRLASATILAGAPGEAYLRVPLRKLSSRGDQNVHAASLWRLRAAR